MYGYVVALQLFSFRAGATPEGPPGIMPRPSSTKRPPADSALPRDGANPQTLSTRMPRSSATVTTSPLLTSRLGTLTRAPLTRTWPEEASDAAAARVRTTRACHNHRSIRCRSADTALHPLIGIMCCLCASSCPHELGPKSLQPPPSRGQAFARSCAAFAHDLVRKVCSFRDHARTRLRFRPARLMCPFQPCGGYLIVRSSRAMITMGLGDHKNPAVSSPGSTGRSSTPCAIEL
jgi:hypothetical protein